MVAAEFSLKITGDNVNLNLDVWHYLPKNVSIDSGALSQVDLSALMAHPQDLIFQRGAIHQFLCEYGAIAYASASLISSGRLAVVVWPPNVWFCRSQSGPDGVFLAPYDLNIHGEGQQLSKGLAMENWSNLEARRDGWSQCHFSSEVQYAN